MPISAFGADGIAYRTTASGSLTRERPASRKAARAPGEDRRRPRRREQRREPVEQPQTNRIRQYIKEKYIDPARRRGAKTIIIKAGEISTEMRIKNGQPAVAGALGANKFEMFAAVETISHEGPIMGAGTVFTFQVLRSLSSLPR